MSVVYTLVLTETLLFKARSVRGVGRWGGPYPFPVPKLDNLHQFLPSFKYCIMTIFYIVIKTIPGHAAVFRHPEAMGGDEPEGRTQEPEGRMQEPADRSSHTELRPRAP